MVAKKPFDPQLFLSVVGTGKTVSKYRKGEVIFAQGDVADSIYYLQRGRVKVVVLSEQGKEAVVGLIEAGPIFGGSRMKSEKIIAGTNSGTEAVPFTSEKKVYNACADVKETKTFAV